MINYKKYVFSLCLSVSAFGQEEQETNFYTKKQFLEDISNDDKRIARKADYFHRHCRKDSGTIFTLEEVKFMSKKSLEKDSPIYKIVPWIIAESKIDFGAIDDVQFFKLLIEINDLDEAPEGSRIIDALSDEFSLHRGEKKQNDDDAALMDLLIDYGAKDFNKFEKIMAAYDRLRRAHEEFYKHPVEIYQGIYDKVGIDIWQLSAPARHTFLYCHKRGDYAASCISPFKIKVLEDAIGKEKSTSNLMEFSDGQMHTMKGIYKIKLSKKNIKDLDLYNGINLRDYDTFSAGLISLAMKEKRAVAPFFNSAIIDEETRSILVKNYKDMRQQCKNAVAGLCLNYIEYLPQPLFDLIGEFDEATLEAVFEEYELEFEPCFFMFLQKSDGDLGGVRRKLLLTLKKSIKEKFEKSTLDQKIMMVYILSLGEIDEAKSFAKNVINNALPKESQESVNLFYSDLSAIFHQDFGTDRQKWLEFLEAKP